MRATTNAVPLRPRTLATLIVASAIGLVAFGWPFLAAPGSSIAGHPGTTTWLFALLLPLVVVVVLADVADGGLDAKAVATLGVLIAVDAALRPLGVGHAGLEPMWVIVILGARVLGPGFGFALGSIGLFVSALLTAGVGPWLPFQMLGAGWLGVGAGLLPAWRGRAEIALLAGYAVVSSLAYGWLLNLWFWPWANSSLSRLAYVPGAAVDVNVRHWLAFNVATSLGFDLVRALVTLTLVVLAGKPLLIALRRGARRAAFGVEAPSST
jgi:energy-coupling factor transport system substrate-specific component